MNFLDYVIEQLTKDMKMAVKTKKKVKATPKKKTVKTVKPKVVKVPKVKAEVKSPIWEIYLNVMNPKINRPRRTSLHTLAYVCGYNDPLVLAKEMKASGKVVGYVCPDVKTPIFYLKKLARHPGMIDTRDPKVWGKWGYETAGATSLPDFIVKNPFPEVKGFRRFARGYWTGGSYGRGKYIMGKSAMNVPYEKDDYDYAKAVIKTLDKNGYKANITVADLI